MKYYKYWVSERKVNYRGTNIYIRVIDEGLSQSCIAVKKPFLLYFIKMSNILTDMPLQYKVIRKIENHYIRYTIRTKDNTDPT